MYVYEFLMSLLSALYSNEADEIYEKLAQGEKGRGPRKIEGPHLKDHVGDLYSFQVSVSALLV